MSLFDLTGKVAVVTGSTKGIGLAIAERMAEHGAKVVVSSRKPDACEAVAAGIRAKGGEAVVIPCHVARKEELQKLVDQTIAQWGGIDIMVSNAAVNPYLGPPAGASDEVYERVMGANVRTNFWLANMVCPHMAERGGGSFIIISSIGGLLGTACAWPLWNLQGRRHAAGAQCRGGVGAQKRARQRIAPGLVRTDFARALWEDPVRYARRRATIRCNGSASQTRSPGRRCSWHRRPVVLSPATRWWWTAARWPASSCKRMSDSL